MSDVVEYLEVGPAPDRARGPRRSRGPSRRRRVVVRVVVAVVSAFLLAAVVGLGLLRQWDQRHVFSAAQVASGLSSFAGAPAGGSTNPVSGSELSSMSTLGLKPERCSELLGLGSIGAIDGASWYSADTDAGKSSPSMQVARFADGPSARRAHTALRAALVGCDGVDAQFRDHTVGEGYAVSYDIQDQARGLNDRLGLTTTWQMRIHQGTYDEGITLHVVSRTHGNLVLVGIAQSETDENPTTATRSLIDRVSDRLDELIDA